MGRNRKYDTKTDTICLSIEMDVLELIEKKAKRAGKNRSEYITAILRHFAYNEGQFCKMKARKAAQDLFYWKSRAETMEAEPELYKEIIA